MNLSAPSWDLFIVLFGIITIGYGFLMQRERIVVTIAAAYISLALTSLTWQKVFGFFHGDNPLLGRYFIRAEVSETQVQIGLFVLLLLLVSNKGGLDAARGKGWLAPAELIILSGLTAALILTTILGFLPAENTTPLIETSKFVSYLVQYHEFITLAPILFLIYLGFRDGRRGD